MPIQKVCVIGAGVMGHGIAQLNAMRGIATLLIDEHEQALQHAKDTIHKNLNISIAKGKFAAELLQKTLDLIDYKTNFDQISDVDLLIEAVPEKMALKKLIFEAADALLPTHALLATNTSSLSVSEIAVCTKRPESVVGLHFFNPPPIMKLLEIVRTEQTSHTSVEMAIAYAAQLQKTHILVNDSPGFATSRLGICLGNEAMRMLEQGVANASDIDQAMVLGYGHPVGPLQLTDIVGLDVRLAISEYLFTKLQNEAFRPPEILKRKVSQGFLGKKSGQGFYAWNQENFEE